MNKIGDSYLPCIAMAHSPQVKATEAGLLNRYGVPNTQTFASYGYSAAMHTDRDDSVTVGWISARSKKVGLCCPAYVAVLTSTRFLTTNLTLYMLMIRLQWLYQ
jgi:hypothetical protein